MRLNLAASRKSIDATNDQLFPAPWKSSEIFLALFTLNTLRWPMGTLSMCVPDIAQHRPTNQVATSPFSKAIPEVQHSGKREKKFNLISPPLRKVVQEKMARPGWSPSNYSKSHLLQPFSAQGWLDASNCGWIGTFDALSQDTNRKLWDLSSKLDLLSVANLHNQNDEKTAPCCFKCSSGRLVSLLGESLPPSLPILPCVEFTSETQPPPSHSFTRYST